MSKIIISLLLIQEGQLSVSGERKVSYCVAYVAWQTRRDHVSVRVVVVFDVIGVVVGIVATLRFR